MHGLNPLILIPFSILGCAIILYFGLLGKRKEQLERRRRSGGWR
jgi:hypothetical protein